MVAISQLHYVVLGAKDLDAWANFATDGLGMTIAERDEDHLFLRCDRWLSRLQIVHSDNEDIHALGWSVINESDLDELIARLKIDERPYQDMAGAEIRKLRKAMRLIRFSDDDGIVHEVAWGMEVSDRRPFISPLVVDGFRTQDLGLGHVVLSIDDLERSIRFFKEVLGHQVTSHLFIGPHEAAFLRCNPRHHSVALSVAHRPQRLQHLQIEFNSMDDLGRAMDRAESLPLDKVVTLGKHASDFVTSFYVRAPSGIVIELGYGARIIRDDEPAEYETFTGSIWGHLHGMENA